MMRGRWDEMSAVEQFDYTVGLEAKNEQLREALTAAALGEPRWRENAMRLVGIDPETGEMASDITALPPEGEP